MVAKSYIRLILLSVFILFSNKLIHSMDNINSEITLDKAYSLYEKNKLLIFDIRTKKEWKMTGVIPNSILINMHDNNNLERENFLNEVSSELELHKNENIAFICASGARSKVVMDFFINKGYKNIFHIPDGIMGKQSNGWLFQGYPVTNYVENKALK